MPLKTNIVIPPAAGLLLYKAYKSGSFTSLKDKIFKSHNEISLNENTEIGQVDEARLSSAVPNGTTIIVEEADTIHGLPAQNIEFDPTVYQFYDDTCAIQSQHLILKQYGINVTQEELIDIAKEQGWYAEGYGTPMDMVGKLLEYYGVDIHGSQGNNIFNIANELAQGHQIIVGVDAYELIYPEETVGIDELYGEHANHALVVVGIDTSDPDNVQVIVTDPGTGNRQMAYPADQFIDAWKDSNCFMVTTETVPDNPLWDYAPIDNFAGIPMESLDRLAGMEIDSSSHETYDDFVTDLLANPLSFEDLLSQYADLFDFSDDEF
ncbi:C39 family peptidase [Bacteroides caecimuris]|jgi:hypothetical protein|uniref:C39 family peptidase n=1 Tax=Bacteroides caecimuris TaxID=1796613 RepID=UPI00265AE597|nr:C39 family peptidase [Bacteroides caecimuris]